LRIDGFRLNEYSGRRLWDGKYDNPLVKGTTNVYLYKLHGSLDWKKHKSYGIEATGEESRSHDPNYADNMLVYPTVSPKDGEETEPYRTIRENFRGFMESADACIVIGFSFRDEHINSIFSNFLKHSRRIIVVSPSADKDVPENLLKRPRVAHRALWTNDENVTVYKRWGTDIITINYPLTSENAGKIMQIIHSTLSYFLKDNEEENLNSSIF
jgi:hypothetical protein